jgi:hypothetical protein
MHSTELFATATETYVCWPYALIFLLIAMMGGRGDKKKRIQQFIKKKNTQHSNR